MNKFELKQLQSLPLDLQIIRFYRVVEDYIALHGLEGVYSSFSGGKDSTVGTYLLRLKYPDIKAVFCDTGLEYLGVKKIAMSFDNVDVIRPSMSFVKVIETYGYPFGSKKISRMFRDLMHPTSRNKNSRRCYWWGIKQDGSLAKSWKLSEKWKKYFRVFRKNRIYLSEKCCNEMKKKPFKAYTKLTVRKPIVFTMAVESNMRQQSYLQTGCINKKKGQEMCLPMATWTEQHILEAIQRFSIPIAAEYGDILETEKGLCLSGEKRTGCIFCGYGCHMEVKSDNRFIRLKEHNYNRWKYAIYGGEYKEIDGVLKWVPSSYGLGLWRILELLGIPYDDVNEVA